MSAPSLTLKYFVIKARGEIPRLILRGAGGMLYNMTLIDRVLINVNTYLLKISI